METGARSVLASGVMAASVEETLASGAGADDVDDCCGTSEEGGMDEDIGLNGGMSALCSAFSLDSGTLLTLRRLLG